MDVFSTYITLNGAPGRGSNAVQDVRTLDELQTYGREMWHHAYAEAAYMFVSTYVRIGTEKASANLTYQKAVNSYEDVSNFLADIWREWETINLRTFVVRPGDARLPHE